MILKTNRAIIRKLNPTDINDLVELYNDEQIFQHEFDQPREYGHVEDVLLGIIDEYNMPIPSRFEYGVQEKSKGKIIGIISYEYKDPEQLVCELGGWLKTEYTKVGLGLEIGQKIIEHIFDNKNTVRIFCSTSSLNLEAINLVEKLGFEKEGHVKMAIYLHGKYVDEVFYGLMADNV